MHRSSFFVGFGIFQDDGISANPTKKCAALTAVQRIQWHQILDSGVACPYRPDMIRVKFPTEWR